MKPSLTENSIKMGRDSLFSYLRSHGLLVKPLKNYTKTTFSHHRFKKHPNLLANLVVTRPEEVFVSDITYVKSDEGVHYLSLVTDAYTRRIMGHHLSHDMKADSVVKALKIAVKNRRGKEKLIHHSDRGSQYCSDLYQKELRKNAILPSTTDGYDCYQNALAERINGILKQEFLLYRCKTFSDLKVLVDQSINIYNQFRPHLSLEMKTPNQVHKKTSCRKQLAF
jgi:transposase InsO family protein